MSDSQGFPPPPPPQTPLALPPQLDSEGRTAPPWEREGPMLQRYVDTVRAVLLQPGPFFRGAQRTGGLASPVAFALVGIVIGAIGSALTRTMMPFEALGPFGAPRGVLAEIILVPLFSVVFLFIGAAILHLLFLLVASSRQSFETTLRLMAYTSGSTSPLNIVPIVGGLAAGIWALFIMIVGGAEAHEVPPAKAAIAVLLPAVLCCAAAILFGSALIALVLGAVAAGARS